MMKTPLIVVNFKNYEHATGKKALELARIHQKVARQTGVNFAIAVQPLDLRMIAENVDLPVLAQHFDPVELGAFTGHISPHALKEAGAIGSLINHAERKMPPETIKKSIEMAHQIGFFTIVCAETAQAGKGLNQFNPDFIAIEPPELIGGDVSVSTAKPELISDAVKIIGSGKVLVGAGIKNKMDVLRSLELGASGVLLASGVTKSPDPEKTLLDLAEGVLAFKKARPSL